MSEQEHSKKSKMVIYQMLPRLFGNTNQANTIYGTIEENGCGKFNDVSAKCLEEIKKLGATHIYYTGVIRHATCTDYEHYGILKNNPLVIKGKAGSPFAVTDYYDVNPDLAVDVNARKEEFQDMVKRTHDSGLKAIIDFIPNHVAREYKSKKKPAGIQDLGEGDNNTKHFLPQNNFYYMPGQSFKLPEQVYDMQYIKELKVKSYKENPAKATGNNLFKSDPGFDDWYETIKLNYGVDYHDYEKKHFDHTPDTWIKMKDILLFWASQNVDGFRCDTVEIVPAEFWEYAIAEVRKKYPKLIFIAEIFNPEIYRQYIEQCGFDYLYDKEIFYKTLRGVIEGNFQARAISSCWQRVEDYEAKMLRFMENHDEQRIASGHFAGDPFRGLPAVVIAATMGKGPLMLYSGQETGEPADGVAGFSGDDGCTTIYDYWAMPQHQKWMNKGQFDGGLLNEKEYDLRNRYEIILKMSHNQIIADGEFYDLMWFNKDNSEFDGQYIYTFMRYKNREAILVLVNFSPDQRLRINIKFPNELIDLIGIDYNFTLFGKDAMPGEKSFTCDYKEIFEDGLFLIVEPLATHIFQLEFDPW